MLSDGEPSCAPPVHTPPSRPGTGPFDLVDGNPAGDAQCRRVHRPPSWVVEGDGLRVPKDSPVPTSAARRGMWDESSSKGQLEPDGDRVNDLLHLEQADEARGQLLRLHPEWKILGPEPHPLAQGVVRSRGMATVGLLFHPHRTPAEGNPKLPPSPFTPLDKALN